MRHTVRRTAFALAGLLLLTACGGDEATDEPPVEEPTTDDAGDDDAGGDDGEGDDGDAVSLSGDLTVFAAASLTDAFEELAEDFQAEHPDLTVSFNFASSSTLATQLLEGAPGDLFASANETQMDNVTDDGLASGPTTFVTNGLEIVVEAGNPLDIAGLEDLARDDVILVLAAPDVPAGQYAEEMLDEAGIEVSPSSQEVDVRSTLSKVELGEADAAIVYESDVVTASDSVEGVAIPEDQNVLAIYPIVVLDDAPNPEAAQAFFDLVLSDAGQAVLEAAGFRPAA